MLPLIIKNIKVKKGQNNMQYKRLCNQANHIYQIIAIDDHYTLKSPLTNNNILTNHKEIIRKTINKDEFEEIIDH